MSIEFFNDTCLYIGIVSLVILLVKSFIPFDTGSEVGGDFTTITDSDTSFNLLSLESILSFFMCFGFMGWWANNFQHYSFKLCLLIASVCGFVGMLFFSFLFAQIKKFEFIPKNDISDLTNKTGKAYTKFNPKGNGQIQIEFNSKLATIDAVSVSEEEINSFELVKVIKVENNVIYIDKA